MSINDTIPPKVVSVGIMAYTAGAAIFSRIRISCEAKMKKLLFARKGSIGLSDRLSKSVETKQKQAPIPSNSKRNLQIRFQYSE
jgi:hypothetical protein